MTELDREGLASARAWAAEWLARRERRQATKPLVEAMGKTIAEMQTKTFPSIMAGPQAQVRGSVAAMETSIAAFPATLAESDEKRRSELARTRARTAALRAWLEALS